MKIALIGQKGIPMKFGGIEKHVERLAVGLVKRGHEVYVYTRPWYTAPSKKKYQGVKLISLKSLNTKHLDAISHTLFATLHALRQDYDIIHYHGVGPALLAWIPRIFKPNTKVISTFHCIDRFHQKWGLLARSALYLGELASVKFSHDTITVSRVLQRYSSDNYRTNTIYVPNGVDLHKSVKPQIIKKKYGLQKGNYLLFISRLVRHKGAHYLIDAYNSLKTDKKLVIAGGSAFTDDYIEFLKKKAQGNPNIIFTGNVEGESREWQELYANAHMFVHPSESEGLPVVVLEALSFGLPALVSGIPENMEAIENGEFGFYFKNRSVKDLKNKIAKLLKNPRKLAKVAQTTQNHVAEEYNWLDICRGVEKVYEDSLQERKVKAKLKTVKI